LAEEIEQKSPAVAAEVWAKLSQSFWTTGRIDLALKYSGEALALRPDDHKAQTNLAYAEVVSGDAEELPVNLPNNGNVDNLADDAVVEIMGIADNAGVRGRDRTAVPGIMGEYLRRINVAQEWTVDAALSGNAELVLEAMLADPLAAQLSYENVVAMTGDMLAATARWLPQFA
jgi:alpha-galactosidase/6-phospho-beta-glucosidase family protein